jgi:3-oxoacyl-[acyl-carrier protein] reductase
MTVKPSRVAIVTGGSYGIGKACSAILAESGAHVAILSRKRKEGLEAAEELNRSGGKALHIETDVADREQIRRSVARVYDEFHRIDIVVNNAGIGTPLTYFFEQTDDDWDRVIKVHLYGTFYMMKEVAPIMIRQKYGRIVNISSIVTASGSSGRGNYVAAKCGIEGLTLTTAKELSEFGITVNAVRPGIVMTQLTKSRGLDFDAIKKTIPRQRLGTPEDIARMVNFLSLEESDFITGQIISVDGGRQISGAGIIHEWSFLKK